MKQFMSLQIHFYLALVAIFGGTIVMVCGIISIASGVLFGLCVAASGFLFIFFGAAASQWSTFVKSAADKHFSFFPNNFDIRLHTSVKQDEYYLSGFYWWTLVGASTFWVLLLLKGNMLPGIFLGCQALWFICALVLIVWYGTMATESKTNQVQKA